MHQAFFNHQGLHPIGTLNHPQQSNDFYLFSLHYGLHTIAKGNNHVKIVVVNLPIHLSFALLTN